jgi:hypothetical protein
VCVAVGGVVPKSWIAHSAGGLAPAVQFMADYFSLVTPPQHRIVYVKVRVFVFTRQAHSQ